MKQRISTSTFSTIFVAALAVMALTIGGIMPAEAAPWISAAPSWFDTPMIAAGAAVAAAPQATSGQQTPAQARVVDSVLTSIARGYKHAGMAHHDLFPTVPVVQRAGRVINFGSEDFLKRDIVRAPGTKVQRIHYGYGSDSYATVQRALAGDVPDELREDAAAMSSPGIEQGAQAIRKTMAAVQIQIEIEAATNATTPANYAATNRVALAGNAKWSAQESDPIRAIEDAKEVIALGIGLDPNVLVLGPQAFRALRSHPAIRNEITEAKKRMTVTMPDLESIFSIEKVVLAACRYQTGRGGQFKPAWGNNAILAYSAPSSVAEMGSPSFAYTYQLSGYPVAEMPWRDNDARSWVYPVITEDTPVIAGPVAGYLFSGVA